MLRTSPRAIRVVVAAIAVGAVMAGAGTSSAQLGFVPSPVRVIDPAVSGRTVDLTVSLSPDEKGKQIAPLSLPPSAFSVREGTILRPAVARRLADDKLEVAVVADTSRGAMDPATVRATVNAFVGRLPAQARVSIVSGAPTPVVLSPMSTDRGAVSAALDKLQPTEGEAVLDAVSLATGQFSRRSGVRRTVLMVEAPFSVDTGAVGRANDRLTELNVDSYVLQSNQATLGSGVYAYPLPLGGGRAFYALDADLPILGGRVADELRRQYRLTFGVSGAVDPTLVSIRIRSLGKTLTTTPLVQLHLLPPSTGGGWPLGLKLALLGAGLAAILALVFVPARRARARAAREPIRPLLPPAPADPVGGAVGGVNGSTAPASRRSSTEPTHLAAVRPGPGLGGEQVEGRESVRELLRAQARQVRTVWLADDVEDPTIEELAARARVPVRRASRSEIEAVSTSPLAGGVLAHAAPLPTVYLDDLGDPSEGAQTVLVVDHMTDAPLGALIRTAVFCGVTAVVLPRQRSSPVSPTATGAARGAIEDVKMVLTSSLPPALGRLRHHGFLIVGIDADAPDRLLDVDVDFARSRVALVIDGRGRLDDSLRARCNIFAGVELASGVGDTPEAIGQRACIELARCRIPGALR